MKRLFSMAVAIIICGFAACEKEFAEIKAPLGNGVQENAALADSLDALQRELFTRVWLSDMAVAKLGKVVWKDAPPPPVLDTARVTAVSASEAVHQRKK